MKKQSKKIVLSAVAALAFGAISAGATFALFTSDAKTDINIGSGKINLTMSVGNRVTYSAKYNTSTHQYDSVETAVQGTFTNSGTASFNSATSVLTLDRITPGDRVTFPVSFYDDSNVDYKYRFVYELQGADATLAKGLVTKTNISGTQQTYESLKKYASEWKLSSESSIEDANFTFDIELPVEAGNEYQDKTAAFKLSVEAIQANAHTEGEAELELIAGADEEEADGANDVDFIINYDKTDEDANVSVKVPKENLTTNDKVDLIVTNVDLDDSQGTVVLDLDISLYINDRVATGLEYPATVKIYIGEKLENVTVSHNGEPISFTYNNTTGEVTFTTSSFSPFQITYTVHVPYTLYGFSDSYPDGDHWVHEIKDEDDFENIFAHQANEERKAVAGLADGKTVYRLVDNIDLTEFEAPSNYAGFVFNGVLDGNNKTIRNWSYSGTDFVGLFAKSGEKATAKDLTLDNISIRASGGCAGVLFGGTSFSGNSGNNDGRDLYFENVTITSTCSVIATTGNAAGIIGQPRYYGSLTIKNCTNNATIVALSNKHAAGLFGSASGVVTLLIEGNTNNGAIYAPGYVAGIGSQFHVATSCTIKDNTNNGLIVKTMGKNGPDNTVGWFCCHYPSSYNMSGNVNTGTIRYDGGAFTEHSMTISGVCPEMGFDSNKITSGNDIAHTDNTLTTALHVEKNDNEQFVADPVSGAVKYTVTIGIVAFKGRLVGSNYELYESSNYRITIEFNTVEELKNNFKRISRVGFVFNNDSSVSGITQNQEQIAGDAYTRNNFGNFFRTNAGYDSTKLDQPYQLSNGEFALVHLVDTSAEYGLLFNPLSTNTTYTFNAIDANGVAIATGTVEYEYAGSNTLFTNMAGETWNSGTDYTGTNYHNYTAA